MLRDGAHENLRLRVLLTWAVDFVERETTCLEESYRDPKTGEFDDEDVSVDITDARKWLVEAREALR